MVGDFARGFRYGVGGLRWLTRPGLRHLVIAPIGVNAVIFLLGFFWLTGRIERAHDVATGWLPDWLDWLAWLLWPLAITAMLIIVWTGFTMIANLLGSPFNGLLSERVVKLRSPDATLSDTSLLSELVNAPLAEINKLLYFAVLAVPALLIVFLPVLNILAPLVWAIYGAWIMAVEYCDYPMSNAGIRLRSQRRLLRRRRGLALGFGAGVMTMTLIPGLNLVAMPAAVIGATLLWCDRFHGQSGDLS